jgi:hypothetical protein
MIQEKPSALKREHPSLQALLDPDPIRIRIRIHNTVTKNLNLDIPPKMLRTGCQNIFWSTNRVLGV